MAILVATPRSATALSALPSAAHELIAAARRSLTEAIVASTAADRYAAAHLAALRAAAAVLATRGRVQRKSRSRVRSVWQVLPEVAGEFAEHPQVHEILDFIRDGGERAICTPVCCRISTMA